MDQVVIAITAILCVGGLAQWLGWRLRMPAIVFLLAAGLIVGPLTGWLEPDQIMGDTLFPLVSMACPPPNPRMASRTLRATTPAIRAMPNR